MKIIKQLHIHYKTKGHEKSLEAIKKYYQKLEKIEDVISKATMGVSTQVLKHPHQRRIPNMILHKFSKKLISKKKEIQSVSNFQSLYSIIQQNKIIGIGDLTIYDTALRIGFYLKKYPKSLFVQAGSKVGYKRLLNVVIVENPIHPDSIPKFLKNIKMYHLENILCIYNKCFLCKELDDNIDIDKCSLKLKYVSKSKC